MKWNKVLGVSALIIGLGGAMTVTASAAAASSVAPISASGAMPMDGTGTVVENSTDTSAQREFFTIKTAAGNVFYIVVDKEKTSDNVYLLTPVTESDLIKLAGSKTADTITGGTTTSQQQTNSTVSQEPTTSSQSTVSQAQNALATNKSSNNTKAQQSSGVGTIAFVILAVLIVGGAGFYFKIYKPHHEMGNGEDDMEETEPEDKAEESDSSDDDSGSEDE
jgi:hypothetical protein